MKKRNVGYHGPTPYAVFKNRNFRQILMPKIDSLAHFHSNNVYFIYIEYGLSLKVLFFKISGLTPTHMILKYPTKSLKTAS